LPSSSPQSGSTAQLNPKEPTMLKTLLTTAALGLAVLAAQPATAQNARFNGASAPASQQGGGITLPQYLLGTWTIESREGRNVATYLPDGSVNGIVFLRSRPQPIPFQGRWSVRPLGGDRFELIVQVGRQTGHDTLRLQADGTLYNETARAVAYRID
jgi:hypothetical protein